MLNYLFSRLIDLFQIFKRHTHSGLPKAIYCFYLLAVSSTIYAIHPSHPIPSLLDNLFLRGQLPPLPFCQSRFTPSAAVPGNSPFVGSYCVCSSSYPPAYSLTDSHCSHSGINSLTSIFLCVSVCVCA